MLEDTVVEVMTVSDMGGDFFAYREGEGDMIVSLRKNPATRKWFILDSDLLDVSRLGDLEFPNAEAGVFYVLGRLGATEIRVL